MNSNMHQHSLSMGAGFIYLTTRRGSATVRALDDGRVMVGASELSGPSHRCYAKTWADTQAARDLILSGLIRRPPFRTAAC